MAKAKSEHIEARNKEICEAWLDGASKRDLALQHGIETQTVGKIIKAAGLTSQDRRVTPRRRSLIDRRPISRLHTQLGSTVSYVRHFKLGRSVAEFAQQANMSPHRLVQIENGVYDPRLSELTRLSELIGEPLDKLVKPKNPTFVAAS